MSHLRLLGIFAVPALIFGAPSPKPLVVHEWGTITTHHAPGGKAIGGLNRIDSREVLPAFVHRYEPDVTKQNVERSLLKTPAGPGRPDVTMRLETPVIYFHVPDGVHFAPFDVDVTFRGGVLNEFYPAATPSLAMDDDRMSAMHVAWDGTGLNALVKGSLHWGGVSLRDSVPLPGTSNHVWISPRAVHSSGVQVPNESERYLFYRGVAHLDALLQTEFTKSGVELKAPAELRWMPAPSMTLARVWLVDVRADGTAAFREERNVVIPKDAPACDLALLKSFASSDYSPTNIPELKGAMKHSLMAAGLFSDEADAMLETWRDSYFGTPGLHVLYMVPNEWTSYFLPLRISIPSELTRVLVGRIDIIR